MGMIKGLIFDFDGLILDTEVPSYDAWSQLYADYGLELDINAWANGLGSSEAAFNPVTHLQGMLNHTVDEAMLRKTARVITDRAILQQPPLPGVIPTLNAARQAGLKLAVASSSPRAWVIGHLKRLELTSYFDIVVCMEDVPQVKPAPDLYLAALYALGLSPHEVIAFEDSPNGITAARRAKIFTVGVPNAVSSRLNTAFASLLLPRIDAMPLTELVAAVESAQVTA